MEVEVVDSDLFLICSFIMKRSFLWKSATSELQHRNESVSPFSVHHSRSVLPRLRHANRTLHTVGNHYSTLLYVLPAEESIQPFQYKSDWWETFEKKRKEVLFQYDW